MAAMCRLDPHAHLYDPFCLREWCQSAILNLNGSPEVPAVVIVVDRDGQDSMARLRGDGSAFADVVNVWGGTAVSLSFDEGQLTVVQGTQYVTRERLEVLALGAQRAAPDGMMVSEYISIITEQGGLACLPWSPGKWLGSRGKVVRQTLDAIPSTVMAVGDISIRSRLGPPSTLLRYAKSRGFSVLTGTDPLPQAQDERLVGSFGLEISLGTDLSLSWEGLKKALITPSSIRPWGRRNSLPLATRRFISSLAR